MLAGSEWEWGGRLLAMLAAVTVFAALPLCFEAAAMWNCRMDEARDW